MRTVLLSITLLLFALVSQAQTTTASLKITLTDVQSVTFSSAALREEAAGTKLESKNEELHVLSSSTSQIKKISSGNSEYENLYNEFYSDKVSGYPSSSTKIQSIALNNSSPGRNLKSGNISKLVIYQVDPR